MTQNDSHVPQNLHSDIPPRHFLNHITFGAVDGLQIREPFRLIAIPKEVQFNSTIIQSREITIAT